MNTSDITLRVVYAAFKNKEELGPGEMSKEDLAKQTDTIEKLVNKLIRTKLPQYKDKVFAVGGFVRDRLLGKNPKDLDLVVDDPKDKMKAAEIFAGKLADLLDIRTPNNPHVLKADYGIWGLDLVNPKKVGGRPPFTVEGVDVSGYTIEITPPRKEGPYDENKREPTSVDYASREEDAVRRDLTINALYKNITRQNLDDSPENIEDYTGGVEDLKNKTLRKPDHPTLKNEQIYLDDPLRIFRLVRFAGKLPGFKVDPKTERIVKNFIKSQDGRRLLNIKVSKDRIRDEFSQIITNPNGQEAANGLEKMKDWGLLEYISPELNKMMDVFHDKVFHKGENIWDHTLDVLKATPPTIKARLAALFHDIGKVNTKTEDVDKQGRPRVHFLGHEDASAQIIPRILAELKFPSDIIKSIQGIAHAHMGLKDLDKIPEAEKNKKIRIFIEKLFHDVEDAIALIKADAAHMDDPSMKAKELAEVNKLEQEIKAQIDKDMKAGLIVEKNVGNPQYTDPLSGSDIQEGYKEVARKRLDKARQKQGLPFLTDEEFKASFRELEGRALGAIKDRLKEMLMEGKLGDRNVAMEAKEQLKNIIGDERSIQDMIARKQAKKPKGFYSV